MKRAFLIVSALCWMALMGCSAHGQNQNPAAMPAGEPQGKEAFSAWLEAFLQDAKAQGVDPAFARRVLAQVNPDDRVVELDRKQPETTVRFTAYSRSVLSPARIKKGRRLVRENKSLLRRLSKRYGVPSAMIVALWGVESGFGDNQGDFRVLDSLATLAYEGRRASFFRQELIQALLLLKEEGSDPASLRGSWAGAMGQCQFMPSTYRRYAVDENGDGKRNIWTDEADALASIARYLAAEGWKAGATWGREVKVTRKLAAKDVGLETRHSLATWGKLGVRTLERKALPASNLSASVVMPDGPGGRAFLVYDNFRALMRWNRSTYFAASVGLLSDKLAVAEHEKAVTRGQHPHRVKSSPSGKHSSPGKQKAINP